MDVHDQASLVDVNVWRVCPACIATKDGGATPANKIQFKKYIIVCFHTYFNNHLPMNVPKANGVRGTPITGADILINQFGKNGVTLKNMI